MDNSNVTSTMTSINGGALLQAFKKRNLNHKEIAQEYGYSQSYFTSCARHGAIRTSLAELLWNEHNIPLDEYKAGDDTAAPAANSSYEIVYKAVCDAINDAQNVIYAAVYGAIKRAFKEAGIDERR